MPAVINRVTWCLDMETLLLRFPSLKPDRAEAAGCPQGADPAKEAGSSPDQLPSWSRSGGPGCWLGVDAYRSKGRPAGVIAP